MATAHTTISSTVKTYPHLPYDKIKTAILGPDYDLSVVFIGSTRARALNQTTRGKSYTPNVLSFPLSSSVGEIYICPRVANIQAKQRGSTARTYIGFLFIHGCLHLKGYAHGTSMERLEETYCRQFRLE